MFNIWSQKNKADAILDIRFNAAWQSANMKKQGAPNIIQDKLSRAVSSLFGLLFDGVILRKQLSVTHCCCHSTNEVSSKFSFHK